jgi:hypothetical protein
MKVMPSGGADGRRLFVLLALLAVLGIALYYQLQPDTVTTAPAVATQPASNSSGAANGNAARPAARGGRGAVAATSQEPEALRLTQLEEKLPEEPQAKRNLFMFGVKYVAPKPAPPPPPVPVFTPPPVPTPTGPPPIPMKLTSVWRDPYGVLRAYLVETKSGKLYQAVQGQVVAGEFRLVEVGTNYVVMEYLTGAGRRRIPLG